MSVWQLLVRRNLFRRRLRAILTFTGMALGIAFMFGVYTTKDSVVTSANTLVDELGGKTDLIVFQASGVTFDKDIIKNIKETPGVKLAIPSINRGAMLFRKDLRVSRMAALEFKGIDPELDRQVRKYELRSGRFFRSSDQNAVLLNADFAKDRDFELGDTVHVSANRGKASFTVIGLLKNVGVGRAAQGNLLVVPLRTAQETFGEINKVTQVDVVISDNADIRQVKKRLRAIIGKKYEVEKTEKMISAITESVGFLTMTFHSLGYYIIIAGGLLLLSTFRMNIQERQEEIGILRSIGATRSQVLKMMLLESVAYSILGGSFGLVLGWFLTAGMLKAVADYLQTDVIAAHFSLSAATASIVLGLAVSLIASIWPAYKASRIWPAAAIMEAKREQPGWFLKYCWLIGLLATSLGVSLFMTRPDLMSEIMFLLFAGGILMVPLFLSIGARLLRSIVNFLKGTKGLIAMRNLDRNFGRAAIAIMAIVSSILMIIWINAYSLSLRAVVDQVVADQIGFDFDIGFAPLSVSGVNRQPPLPYSWRRKVEKIDGIKAVQPIRFLPVRSSRKDLLAVFFDPSVTPRAFKTIDGNTQTALKRFRQGKHVIISKTIAKNYGLSRDGYLALKTPEGWKRFKIAGIMTHVANQGNIVYLARSDLKTLWHDNGIDYFSLFVKPGVPSSGIREALIKEIGNPAGWPVMSESEYAADTRKISDQMLAPLQSMVLLLILVSGFGILNMMIMNIIDRRREIGVLRAIGSFRGHLRRLMMYEAGALGLIGGVFGIALGLPFSYVAIVVAEEYVGMGMEYFFPGAGIVSAMLASLGLALLSAAYPAQQAAKLPIVNALREE